ncbi:Zinc finger protein MAGPIE [Platanthera zijinensis]|uniref:Protein EARLY HEADING DATE 2 n=1 Tax=Platanthera zijinensis TaxID=2320716 RepID=A0AAP0G1J4_9ASPA
MTVSNSVTGEGSVSFDQIPPKKKRNLPGMPDPDAEVIALSPNSLMATNRFVCEICNKGFQRDQNLQLHRRGHNLPWKLRQRTGKEVRKRVYVCPEPSCVHHDPSRALGDLTGIKKHFCRKHGEKKWKCDKCSKKYAVQSDWKAHNKTCGTREYRCDCGTLFSRRDSFITHRAFCEALADNSHPPANLLVEEEPKQQPPPPLPSTRDEEPKPPPPPLAVLPLKQIPLAPPELRELENFTGQPHCPPTSPPPPVASVSVNSSNSSTTTTSGGSSNSSPTIASTSTSLFASLFASTAVPSSGQSQSFSNLITSAAGAMDPPLLCLSSNAPASLFPLAPELRHPPPSPHMSATALLQKAAQIGASSSSSSFLRSLGYAAPPATEGVGGLHWNQQPQGPPAGLGLGLHYDSPLLVAKPATLDFLGLGMGSAFINSMSGGGIDLRGGRSSPAPDKAWDAAAADSNRSSTGFFRRD